MASYLRITAKESMYETLNILKNKALKNLTPWPDVQKYWFWDSRHLFAQTTLDSLIELGLLPPFYQ